MSFRNRQAARSMGGRAHQFQTRADSIRTAKTRMLMAANKKRTFGPTLHFGNGTATTARRSQMTNQLQLNAEFRKERQQRAEAAKSGDRRKAQQAWTVAA